METSSKDLPATISTIATAAVAAAATAISTVAVRHRHVPVRRVRICRIRRSSKRARGLSICDAFEMDREEQISSSRRETTKKFE
jgi:hypothetical protein